MENLLTSQTSSKKCISDMTIGELLCEPFTPVTVLRVLGPYGRMLDLEPTIPKAPTPEFLVRLFTGHVSHQAYIRHAAGRHYKNLENLIRGKHEVSMTTKQVLVSSVGLSLEDLEKLSGSAPDGPLIPELLAIFHVFEGIPTRVTSGILDREVLCPCCNQNLLNDVDDWWHMHAPGMRRAEYHFAERLLNGIIGAEICVNVLELFQERAELPLDRFGVLAEPSRYPIGNWLAEAQVSMSCNSLADLAAAMQLRGDEGINFSHGRLKKWSAGQDVMPLEAGEAIAEACGQTKRGGRRLIAARTIALVTDFVAASLPVVTDTVGRIVAQEIVYNRLEQLGGNLQIAMAAIAGKIPQRSFPPKQY